MEDIGQDEYVALCHIEVRTLVKLEDVGLVLLILGPSISPPGEPHKLVAQGLHQRDQPFEQINRVEEPEYKAGCNGSNVVVEDKANQSFLSVQRPPHRSKHYHRQHQCVETGSEQCLVHQGHNLLSQTRVVLQVQRKLQHHPQHLVHHLQRQSSSNRYPLRQQRSTLAVLPHQRVVQAVQPQQPRETHSDYQTSDQVDQHQSQNGTALLTVEPNQVRRLRGSLDVQHPSAKGDVVGVGAAKPQQTSFQLLQQTHLQLPVLLQHCVLTLLVLKLYDAAGSGNLLAKFRVVQKFFTEVIQQLVVLDDSRLQSFIFMVVISSYSLRAVLLHGEHVHDTAAASLNLSQHLAGKIHVVNNLDTAQSQWLIRTVLLPQLLYVLNQVVLTVLSKGEVSELNREIRSCLQVFIQLLVQSPSVESHQPNCQHPKQAENQPQYILSFNERGRRVVICRGVVQKDTFGIHTAVQSRRGTP